MAGAAGAAGSPVSIRLISLPRLSSKMGLLI
ncbi:hypothetical protein [Serratia sp. DD3]